MKIWVIASNGFREVIRDRILYFIGFFALVMVLVNRILPQLAISAYEKIFLDFGLGFMELIGVIVAIFVGTNLVSKELDKRTVLVLIPKPITLSEFIVGKHLGLSGVLLVMMVAMSVIYLALLAVSSISYPLVPILVAILYLLIKLLLLIAISITLSIFTNSTLATLLTFGIYLMGQLSQELLTIGKLTKNDSLQQITQTLYLFLPDLSRFNLKNQAVYELLPPPLELLNSALYGLIYTTLVLIIGVWVLSKREF